MARALMRMGRKRGVKFLPADHETYIDEVAAYIFAGLGFYFQFSLHFDVPFPFNWLLWPFELAGELLPSAASVYERLFICCGCLSYLVLCTNDHYLCSHVNILSL